MLIVKPLNPVFFVLVLLCLLLALLTGRLERQTAKKVIAAVNIVCAVWLLIYKNTLFLDAEYLQICLDTGVELPTVWNSLPFHFCNMLLFLTPYALSKNDSRLMGMVTYSGLYSTTMSLLMPSPGFSGFSLLIPRVFSYNIIHLAGLYTCVSMLASGLHEPHPRDVLPTFGYTVGLYTLAFGVNVTLLRLGLSQTVNYFYSVSPRTNPALRFFYHLIPLPYLYFMPILALSMLPTGAIGLLWQAAKRRKKS